MGVQQSFRRGGCLLHEPTIGFTRFHCRPRAHRAQGEEAGSESRHVSFAPEHRDDGQQGAEHDQDNREVNHSGMQRIGKKVHIRFELRIVNAAVN